MPEYVYRAVTPRGQIVRNKTEEARTEYVNSGDVIEYITVVSNASNYSQTVVIEGNIPGQLNLRSLQYSINGEEPKELEADGGRYSLEEKIDANQTAKIVLIGEVDNIVSEEDVIIKENIVCRAKIYDREGFTKDIIIERI